VKRLRSMLFGLWMYGSMAVIGLACLPAMLISRSAARSCLRLWLCAIDFGLKAICGITYSVEGFENLPPGGVLVAGNHHSMFETVFFWRVFPDPAIILKKELTRLPVFGWYAVRLDNIAVDREGAASALRDMTAKARERLAQGRQIVIFPEGTRVAPGVREPFKPGVALLYSKLDVACVPVVHNSGLVWPARGMPSGPGHITIRILPAIEAGLDKREFLATLAERIHAGSDALLVSPADR
jgi:1-acyl-sn-glycerol-3-phosphate acyltransferase